MFLNHDLLFFRTTVDYNYILKLQINTSQYFVICIKFILVHRGKAPPSVNLKCIKSTNSSSMAAPRECYEPENKRKYTEPEMERMSDG